MKAGCSSKLVTLNWNICCHIAEDYSLFKYCTTQGNLVFESLYIFLNKKEIHARLTTTLSFVIRN